MTFVTKAWVYCVQTRQTQALTIPFPMPPYSSYPKNVFSELNKPLKSVSTSDLDQTHKSGISLPWNVMNFCLQSLSIPAKVFSSDFHIPFHIPFKKKNCWMWYNRSKYFFHLYRFNIFLFIYSVFVKTSKNGPINPLLKKITKENL